MTSMCNKLDNMLTLGRTLAQKDGLGMVYEPCLTKQGSDVRDLGFTTVTLTYACWLLVRKAPSIDQTQAELLRQPASDVRKCSSFVCGPWTAILNICNISVFFDFEQRQPLSPMFCSGPILEPTSVVSQSTHKA